MRLKFVDNIGSHETLYFNPEVMFYPDGSIIILETDVYRHGKQHPMPMFVGDSSVIWMDLERGMYSNSEIDNYPGTIKVIYRKGGTTYLHRWKERTTETLWQRIKRKWNEIP